MSASPASGELSALVEVMARLRVECDWKAAQTHRSLSRYLLEETHETLEAIDEGSESGDWTHLREELGDLLLQVVFHAAIAAERGDFDLDDVAADLQAKLRRRNPHVFDDDLRGRVRGAASVNELWESMKAAEKRERRELTDGIAPTLPALLYADKVLDRLERAGVAPASGNDELGDRLLALVADARSQGADPEQALRDAVRRLLARSGRPLEPPATRGP